MRNKIIITLSILCSVILLIIINKTANLHGQYFNNQEVINYFNSNSVNYPGVVIDSNGCFIPGIGDIHTNWSITNIGKVPFKIKCDINMIWSEIVYFIDVLLSIIFLFVVIISLICYALCYDNNEAVKERKNYR